MALFSGRSLTFGLWMLTCVPVVLSSTQTHAAEETGTPTAAPASAERAAPQGAGGPRTGQAAQESKTGPHGGSVVHTEKARIEFVHDKNTGKLRAYTLKRAEPLPRVIRVTLERENKKSLELEMSAINPDEDLFTYQAEQGIEDSRVFGARGSSLMGLKFKVRF